jgi:hypothetical protein
LLLINTVSRFKISVEDILKYIYLFSTKGRINEAYEGYTIFLKNYIIHIKRKPPMSHKITCHPSPASAGEGSPSHSRN